MRPSKRCGSAEMATEYMDLRDTVTIYQRGEPDRSGWRRGGPGGGTRRLHQNDGGETGSTPDVVGTGFARAVRRYWATPKGANDNYVALAA